MKKKNRKEKMEELKLVKMEMGAKKRETGK